MKIIPILETSDTFLTRVYHDTLLSNSFSFESRVHVCSLNRFVYMLFLSSINSLRSSSRLRSTDEYPSKDSRIRTFVKLELAFALPEDNGLINRLSPITVPLTGKQNPGRSTSNFPNEPDLLFPLGGDQSADRAAQPTSRNTCWPNVKRSRNHYRLEPNDSNILFFPSSLSFFRFLTSCYELFLFFFFEFRIEFFEREEGETGRNANSIAERDFAKGTIQVDEPRRFTGA